ncbi:MAG: 2'-5' RNA ligase family protein [Chitinophagaceae bacterium]
MQPTRSPIKKNFKKKTERIYFLAIIPDKKVTEEVTEIKEEIALGTGSSHALKVLPHITLQSPFKAEPSLEDYFLEKLMEFAQDFSSFKVTLKDFGSFSRDDSPVLYLKVIKNEALLGIHRKLMNFLQREFGFSPLLARTSFSPHLTLAYRDLSPEQFQGIWPMMENRSYEASFTVTSFHFLRHNGKSWDILQEISLGGV